MHASRTIWISALIVCAGAIALAATAAAQNGSPSHVHSARSADPCAAMSSRWQRMQCESYHRSAPGDEYFGRMKISYLGIDNTAHDVAIEAGAYTTDPRLISKIEFADDALRAWEHRYPGDPQLARSYFLMVQALRKIYTPDAQQRAWAYMQHIIRVYPASYFAKVLRGEVARGFTEHWFALPEICPTPEPIEPRHREPATPTPEPTPIASPTPTPAPGEPKVEIITPPCVEAPSPTPIPEETAPAELPAPEMVPSPEATPTMR